MMFSRADQLLVEEHEDEFKLHALDFHWEGYEPHLDCYDAVGDEEVEFDLEDVRFLVSRKKTCIGRWDGDRYVPCPRHASVTKFGQCPECAGDSFIKKQECIFEPECDGEKCDSDFCRREHVLYLAFYDTRMKIGMSSTRRVDRRLVEQGADAYTIIGKFGSRRKARASEKEISERLRIPQFYRQETLLKDLARPLDLRGMESRYEGIKSTMRDLYGLQSEPLVRLDNYPIQLPLREVPKLLDPWGSHSGELVGVKGRWLVFESDGLKALSLADFPARHLARSIA
jgi:hypothetical protein